VGLAVDATDALEGSRVLESQAAKVALQRSKAMDQVFVVGVAPYREKFKFSIIQLLSPTATLSL